MRPLAGATLVVCLLLPGCSRTSAARAAPPAGAAPAAANPAAPVARIDGRPVTEGELLTEAASALAAVENRYGEEIHGVKARALDALVARRLLEDRARKEGMTVEALLNREVRSKVPEPDEVALRSVYEQTKATRAVPPYPEVRAEIAGFVKNQSYESLRAAYVSRLRAEAAVEILLPPYLPPRIEVKPNGPALGDPKAPVTLVEFSDYECTFCSGAEPTVKRVLAEYPGKVRLVFQPFPLSIHPHAAKASEAALCAGEQGKYGEMHDKLFANQEELEVGNLKAHARALGLDGPAFDRCLDSGRYAPAVSASRALGESLGLNSTPTFFVNGRTLTGVQPFERFREVIEYELSHSPR
ncbi:MAG TPA: thioredoxin domain-containing protein [Thermoanaerobaculia bacterium]|nr:thioredoxin domain-containing protein [Thermoanaerobaculia bacterium]